MIQISLDRCLSPFTLASLLRVGLLLLGGHCVDDHRLLGRKLARDIGSDLPILARSQDPSRWNSARVRVGLDSFGGSKVLRHNWLIGLGSFPGEVVAMLLAERVLE